MDFLEIITIIGFVLAIIEIPIGLFIENKFNLLDRFSRRCARIKNKTTEIEIAFSYQYEGDFKEFKRKLKELYADIECKKDSEIVIDFNSHSQSIRATLSQDQTILLEFSRINCGLSEIPEKINEEIISKINQLKDDLTDSFKFKQCEINLVLPFRWNYVRYSEPKGFKIKDYKIKYQGKDFHTDLTLYSDEKMKIGFKKLEPMVKALRTIL